jgi:hypothetical protein
VYKKGGTKRAQLELALKKSEPHLQTKILRELLIRFPADETIPVFFPSLSPRERARQDVEHILAKLEPTLPLEIPHVISGSEIVKETLQSARTLLETLGPAHAIDRIHTALHGYLKEKCTEQGIPFNQDDQITRLYRLLRENHPSFSLPAGWEVEIDRVMKSQSSVLEQLNRARNDGSFAHPNPPLPEAEAYLFINAATTFFHYLYKPRVALSG